MNMKLPVTMVRMVKEEKNADRLQKSTRNSPIDNLQEGHSVEDEEEARGEEDEVETWA
jgi:hypothetical protein